MPILYVIRHGEPALKGVLLGRTDPPLSPLGRQQCEALEVDAQVIYASPLRRTFESAEALARGREILLLPDLIECSLGDWDGLAWSDIERTQPELAAAKLADWTAVTPPDGEAWPAFTARVDRALDIVHAGKFPAAIVGHLAVNAWIAHRVAGADPLNFSQEYASVRSYEI